MAQNNQRNPRYPTKSVCILDCGLFVELAVTLAKDFGKVYYWTPWESAFPKSNSLLIGTGIPGVERILDFWQHLDDIDLWCFPDVYFGPLQDHLVRLGKRVWGSRMGEELELDRDKSKRHLKSLGFPIGEYKVIKGLDNLRSWLKMHDDQWVKVSRTRGDFESFHSKNYKLIEPRLDELEHNLGAMKKVIEFVVEKSINKAVEVGWDCYTIDGQYPSRGMVGIEIKDKGYVGFFREASEWPKQITDTNRMIAPTLKEYQYRNFLTLEMRITRDGTPYVIDPCCRQGSPPSELAIEMYENMAEVIWEGAAGKLIDPEPKGKFGAELLIHSSWADKNWQNIQFPKKLRDNLKFRNLAIIEGEYYVVPQAVGLPEIGAVIAVGDTQEEATEMVREYASQVEGYFIDVFPDALDEADEQVEKLKSYGIKL